MQIVFVIKGGSNGDKGVKGWSSSYFHIGYTCKVNTFI